MRVLNTLTKELEDSSLVRERDPFRNDLKPASCAILSHCWRDGEVQFQDMSRSDVKKMKGYAKLSAACDTARHLNISHLWMDTCCIDKSSSAELSEAINSMYSLYKEAYLCIVYLDDVDGAWWDFELKNSRWFTRGWTLQELIAPRVLLFFDKHWTFMKTKDSIATLLAEITGIDTRVLRTGDTKGVSIAAKMSWAAKRTTTRPEDMAYSLMGIFDVNMPTIYGEGDKAFIRLQEEIMKKSNDQSLFAWGWTHPQERIRNSLGWDFAKCSGLLATHPNSFKGMNDVVETPRHNAADTSTTEFALTNRGIHIRLPVSMIDPERKLSMALLACGRPGKCAAFAIFLYQVSGDQYTRNNELLMEFDEIKEDDIYEEKHIFVDRHEVPKRTEDKKFLHVNLRLLWHAGLVIFKAQYNRFSEDLLIVEPGIEELTVLTNREKEVLFMLVISLDESEEQPICVKVVALGACSDRMKELSPPQIHEMWRENPEQFEPPDSSDPTFFKLPNGQEFELVLVPTLAPKPSWMKDGDCICDLLAIPRTQPRREDTVSVREWEWAVAERKRAERAERDLRSHDGSHHGLFNILGGFEWFSNH